MKKILIPTDFSKHARHTIHCVLDFLQETKIPCQILLLNTYMVQQTDPKQVILLNDEMKKKSKEGLEQDRDMALQKIHNPLISVETASHIGSLNNVILQFMQKEKLDMIAMGKNSGRNIEMVSALLKQLECPLLITHLKESV